MHDRDRGRSYCDHAVALPVTIFTQVSDFHCCSGQSYEPDWSGIFLLGAWPVIGFLGLEIRLSGMRSNGITDQASWLKHRDQPATGGCDPDRLAGAHNNSQLNGT